MFIYVGMHCPVAPALREQRDALGTQRLRPHGSPLQKQQFTMRDNRWHQIPFTQRWKCTVVQHVLGVPLCQKWTGRHGAVPLVMARGAWLWIVPERGGRGLVFPADYVSFSSFLAPTTFILRASIVSTAVFCFHALCFMFSSAASVFFLFVVISDQCALPF